MPLHPKQEDLLAFLIGTLRWNGGDPRLVAAHFYSDNGMEDLWMIVYDVPHEALHDDEGQILRQPRIERRFATGQGTQCQFDGIAKYEEGW